MCHFPRPTSSSGALPSPPSIADLANMGVNYVITNLVGVVNLAVG